MKLLQDVQTISREKLEVVPRNPGPSQFVNDDHSLEKSNFKVNDWEQNLQNNSQKTIIGNTLNCICTMSVQP